MLEMLIDQENLQEGRHWRRRVFRADELIVREGQHGGKVFVVLAGRLQVTGRVVLGTRTIRTGFQILGVGDVIGELALIDGRPHGADVVALTAGELAEIGVDTLRAYLDAHAVAGSRFYRHLAQVLAARLRRTDAKMLSLFGWGLKARGYEGL